MVITQQHIDKAIEIATRAHEGQFDKGGHPYIQHPLRLMGNVCLAEEKIVAVLHDVVEDTDITFSDLEKYGIPNICIEALKLLTHDKSVPYMIYIKSINVNPIARMVKIADLKDNSDLSRLSEIRQKDIERVEKYAKALKTLQS